MRLRHIKGAEDTIKKSLYCINTDDFSNGIDLSTYFKNEKPLYLELGMGKGKFICEMARQNKDISFIGIEKYATVILKAIENFKKTFDNVDEANLRFLCIDVNDLDKFFKKNTVDKIFLNFSDPWPKKRHETRRLTHHSFLSLYEKILKDDGVIEFKTDNVDLFDFSLEELKLSNFKLEYETHDLHNDKILSLGNIETEYEHKFAIKGNPICKYKISKK